MSSRYPVRWSKDSNTLTIEKEGAGDTKTKKVMGEIVFTGVGEVSDGTVRPAPKQHLMSMAMKAGFDDYSLVNVENNSGEKTLDYLEQEADEKKVEQREQFERDRTRNTFMGPATTRQVAEAAKGERGLDEEAQETLAEANAEGKGMQTLERVEGEEGKETGGDAA